MANKIGLGMLAMALALGMMAAGCNRSPAEAALNGTWVDAGGNEMRLNNGGFELAAGDSLVGKGTYTASEGSITMAFTHIHGDIFEGMIESKWYTGAELKESAIGLLFSDEDIDRMFASATTGAYSISGDTLTVTMEGETETYTKK